MAKYREQIDDGPQQDEAHELLEGVHPGTGLREFLYHCGPDAHEDEGQGKSQSHEDENAEDDDGRLRESEAEGGAEKGCGAGGCQEHGYDPVEKGAEITLLSRLFHGSSHGGGLEHVHVEEGEGEDEDDRREKHYEAGILELESPPHQLAGELERGHRRREYRQGYDDAAGVEQRADEDLPPVVVALFYEVESPDGENGQHAGHYVQQDAADEGEEQVLENGCEGGEGVSLPGSPG